MTIEGIFALSPHFWPWYGHAYISSAFLQISNFVKLLTFIAWWHVLLSCSHTYHLSLLSAVFHWYKPCKSMQPARHSLSPVLFPFVDACSLLSTSPLRWNSVWCWGNKWWVKELEAAGEEMTTMSQAAFWIRPPPLGTDFLETQLCTSRGPGPYRWRISRWLTVREEGPISRWTTDPEADRVTMRQSTAEGSNRGCHHRHDGQKWTPIPITNY